MTEQELEQKAIYIFGDVTIAAQWMDLPKRAFGDRTPRQTLRIPGGLDLIDEWVRKMEQGFYY